MKVIQDTCFVLLMTAAVIMRETGWIMQILPNILEWKRLMIFCILITRWMQFKFRILKEDLIFLFRLLKVDTVICWDPWEHYEENPDHIATAHAVEAARWMAQMDTDYPEHLDAGLVPYGPDRTLLLFQR